MSEISIDAPGERLHWLTGIVSKEQVITLKQGLRNHVAPAEPQLFEAEWLPAKSGPRERALRIDDPKLVLLAMGGAGLKAVSRPAEMMIMDDDKWRKFRDLFKSGRVHETTAEGTAKGEGGSAGTIGSLTATGIALPEPNPRSFLPFLQDWLPNTKVNPPHPSVAGEPDILRLVEEEGNLRRLIAKTAQERWDSFVRVKTDLAHWYEQVQSTESRVLEASQAYKRSQRIWCEIQWDQLNEGMGGLQLNQMSTTDSIEQDMEWTN